jgi:preprotein translocase subunit SecE
MIAKLKPFLLESKQEFKRVNWPTFAETRRMTFIVVMFSLAVAVFLGVLDIIFTYLLNTFLI